MNPRPGPPDPSSAADHIASLLRELAGLGAAHGVRPAGLTGSDGARHLGPGASHPTDPGITVHTACCWDPATHPRPDDAARHTAHGASDAARAR